MNYWETCRRDYAHLEGEKKKADCFERWDEHLLPFIECHYDYIIDYGCGGAWLLEWLKPYCDYNLYQGMDISERAIKEDVENHGSYPHLFTHVMDFVNADVLFCMSVVQHMDKKQLEQFEWRLDKSGIEKLFIQIRYAKEYKEGDTMTLKCVLPKLRLDNYYLVNESKVLENGYRYQEYNRNS